MEFTIDISAVLSTLIVVMIGFAMKGIFGIKTQVTEMNGKVGTIETRLDDHEKVDEERMARIDSMLKELRTGE